MTPSNEKHFPRYRPFVRGIHRSPFLHKGQWRGALVFSLICAWINGWVNNRDAGYLRRHRAHYDVTVMTHNFTEALVRKPWSIMVVYFVSRNQGCVFDIENLFLPWQLSKTGKKLFWQVFAGKKTSKTVKKQCQMLYCQKTMSNVMSPKRARDPTCSQLSCCLVPINLAQWHISRVSCQKGPIRHAYAWQIGPIWQDTLDLWYLQ